MTKVYRLRDAENREYEGERQGRFGGDRRGKKLYGRLDCKSAVKAAAEGVYARYRVFFADEAIAIAAGYRPCSRCMPDAYQVWKAAKTAR